jgi:alpha/beta superfamily hydrolase
VEPVLFGTADGLTIAGELSLTAAAAGAAVVCHPHPLYGGDMHNHVVSALVRGMTDAGAVTLRFDFRGVGRSEGSHAGSDDERLDVAAAIDTVTALAPDGPLVLAGYSFGALVGLQVTDPRIDGWLAVAPLLTDGPPPLAAADHRPKRLLLAEHDQFAPPASVEPRLSGWASTTAIVVPMADHFLFGASAFVTDAADAAFSALAAR